MTISTKETLEAAKQREPDQDTFKAAADDKAGAPGAAEHMAPCSAHCKPLLS